MDVLGLPLHPLVVHAAVVLVPLAALGALLLVALPRLRATYGVLTIAVAVAAAASAFVARISGEWLLNGLGLHGVPAVETHMMWGFWTPWPAIVLAVALPVFLWAGGRRGDPRGRAAFVVSGALTVLAALAALGLVVLTGHSGATAVWG